MSVLVVVKNNACGREKLTLIKMIPAVTPVNLAIDLNLLFILCLIARKVKRKIESIAVQLHLPPGAESWR